jgi:hypothetical protein
MVDVMQPTEMMWLGIYGWQGLQLQKMKDILATTII